MNLSSDGRLFKDEKVGKQKFLQQQQKFFIFIKVCKASDREVHIAYLAQLSFQSNTILNPKTKGSWLKLFNTNLSFIWDDFLTALKANFYYKN
ncbi:hypothetical protein KFK09_024401 [Dendrobium nobile]|uniref:Uncharacterized protein n=1 Tax=Dendrobium nobile TaxID=94219 RepID=A0A8T3ADN8_DENNO|nr:hypothetical protein KFK09_024401 [Dendrobium nobile]